MYTWNIKPGVYPVDIGANYSSVSEFCHDLIDDYRRVIVKPDRIIVYSTSFGISIYEYLLHVYPELKYIVFLESQK